MNTNTSNTVLRWVIYVLLAATLFVPILVANSMFFPFITGKALIFRVLVELAFAVWVILALRDKSVRPRISPITVGITVFALVALVADLFGVNPIRSLWSNFERMEGWVTIIHLWAFFMVLGSIFQASTLEKTREYWHRFFNISFVAAFIVAFYGVLQLTGHAAIQQSADRLDSYLGNSEYLAVYMLIHVFLALYMATVAWKKARSKTQPQSLSWIYIALAALYSFIIFGSQTRGTMLALGGGLFIACAIFAFVKDTDTTASAVSSQKRLRMLAGGGLILLVVLAGGFYLARNSSFVQNNGALERLATISIDNPRLQYIWPMAWQGFKEKPILGWGQENFNYVFNEHYNPEMWTQEQWFDRAHNTFIDWAIDGGIIGFAAYASLFILVILAIWKKGVFNLKERAIFTALILAYVIHDMFVFDNLASYLMFFIVLSFFHASRPTGATNWMTNLGKKIQSFTMNGEVISWIVAPIVISVTVFLLYFINYRLYAENVDLIAAMQNCQGAGQQNAPTLNPTLFTTAMNVGVYAGEQEIREQLYSCAEQVISVQSISNDTKLQYYQITSAAFDAQASSTPNDLRGFLFAGSFYNDIGQWSAALPYLERAYQLSPVKQSILFALGQNEVSGATAPASTTDGLALITKGYNEAPDYPQAQTTYAQALYVTGDYTDAVAMFQKVLVGTPSDIQSRLGLAASYEGLKDSANAITQLNIIASSTPADAAAVESYVKQIKAGTNPFKSPSSGQGNPQATS
jgi:O-antigen ligase/cytochrome c-type biogenesis protein CcmH/NrfG